MARESKTLPETSQTEFKDFRFFLEIFRFFLFLKQLNSLQDEQDMDRGIEREITM